MPSLIGRGLNPLPITLINRESVGYSNAVGRCCTGIGLAFSSKITFKKNLHFESVFFL